MAEVIVNKYIILGFVYEKTHKNTPKIRKNENFENLIYSPKWTWSQNFHEAMTFGDLGNCEQK